MSRIFEVTRLRIALSLLAGLACSVPAADVQAACGMGNQCASVDAGGLTIAPAQPAGGQLSKVGCAASDPDGTIVELRFSATGGAFSNGQTSIAVTVAFPTASAVAEVDWTPPAGSGQTFQLTCQPVDNGGLLGTPAPGNASTISVTTGAATQPPAIESLVATNVEVFPGGSTALVVKATDPLGGTLAYAWSASAGVISGDKDADPESVTWTAPPTLGSATVTVIVTNAEGPTSKAVLLQSVAAQTDHALPFGPEITPQRLAVDAIGRYYVTDEMSRVVLIINALGQTLKTLAIEGAPTCAAPAPFEQLFVGDRARRRVDVYNGLGLRVRSMGGPTERMTPTALVADGLGKLYAADGVAAKIHVFHVASGGTLQTFALPPGTLAVGLALAGGKLYVADGHRGQVLVLDAQSGASLSTIGALGGKDGQLMATSGVAVGANGWVFALDAYQARIAVFGPAGQFLTNVGQFGAARGQLKVPLGLVLDPFGRIVVASSSNRRLEFLRLSGAQPVVCAGDQDCDGMPDAWEKQHGLAAGKATDAYLDSDGDGLSNVEEKARGTDPNQADSDGDGVADGAEVAAGKDPLDPSDQRPVAQVFPPYSTEPTLLALDAQLSKDPNQDQLTYRWRQLDGPAALTLTKADSVLARAVATKPGTYRFELKVNDGKIDSAPAILEVTVLQVAPTADAGPDQSVRVQTNVRLDGRFSSDANGDALSYAWKQVAGGTVTLAGANTARPTFVAPSTGLYTFELTAGDGQATSTDRVHVLVAAGDDHLPVAAAKQPAPAKVGSLVELDASDSVDSDGDKLTYRWKQLGGPTVSLTGETEKLATFVPSSAGVHRFELIVNDGRHDSLPQTVDVVVGAAPLAAAGFDQRVEVLQQVSLSCAGSTQVDGELDCAWKQVEGIHVPLRATSSLGVTFVPIESGTYVFELSVAANDVEGTRDRVVVVVDDPPVNSVPRPLVETKPPHYAGQTVLLDGAKTHDPDAGAVLGYAWTQVAGPHVILDAKGATASFVPPLSATYVFELRADDGTDRSPGERVTVPVAKPGDKPPIADAGGDKLVLPEVVATANGDKSSDPEGRPLSFRWRQTGGPTDAAVDGVTASALRVRPAASGYTLRFELVVNDGVLDSTPSVVHLSVVDVPLLLRRVDTAAAVLRVDQPGHPQHGLQVAVDAGSVDAPLSLAIGEITRTWFQEAARESYRSAIFIGPVGSAWTKPLRVSLPLDGEWLEKRGVSAAELGLVRYDHDAGAWQPVEGIEVDLAAGVLHAPLAKPGVLQVTLPHGASNRVTGGGGCAVGGASEREVGLLLTCLLLLASYWGRRRLHFTRGPARAALFVTVALAVLAASAPAWATDGPHDVAAGRFTQGCVECHTTHAAPDLSGNGNYYNPALIREPQGVANLCTVCHANKTGITWNIDPATGDEALPGTKGSSHSWSGAAVNATYQTQLPVDNALRLRLTNTNNLSCVTCHNPHSQSKLPLGPQNSNVNGVAGWGNKLQRVDNDASQLCFDCHRDRKITSTRTWRDPATNPPFSHPVERALPTTSSSYFTVPREPGGSSQAAAIYGNASSGSSASLLRDTTASWGNLANYWVRMVSGANRGLARQVAAGNTATQLTLTSAFPSVIAANDSYEIDIDGNTTNNLVLSNATAQAGCGTNCAVGTHNQQTTGSCVADTGCSGACQGASQCDATRGFPVCTCATASGQARYAYNGGACDACFATGFAANYPTCTPTTCASAGQTCGHGTCVTVNCATNPCLPAAEHPLEATGACTADRTCAGGECNGVAGACKANPNGDDVHCDCPLGYTGGDCNSCATGFSGSPCASQICAAQGQACGYGTCATGVGRESIVCSDNGATYGGNPACVSASCTGGSGDLSTGTRVGGDCARTGSGALRIVYTVSTQAPNGTAFALWLRVYQDTDHDAPGEDYICSITNTSVGTYNFRYTRNDFTNGTYNPTDCNGGTTGEYCWAAAGGYSGGQAAAITLNQGQHVVTCDISTSASSEPKGFDGIYLDTDRSVIPSSSRGSCTTTTSFDTTMTNGGCGSPLWINQSTPGGLVCSCQTGYAGAGCDQCDAGYTARNGRCMNNDPCSGVTCSGHGTCYVDANDQAACDCTGAYWGATCSACSAFSCSCEAGYGGPGCDQCAAGYVVVNGTCQLDPCASQTCDGNGSCYVGSGGSGACQCTQRFFNSTNPLSCSQCTASSGTSSGSYTQGAVTCQTCHGVHYADSNSSTYDDRPRAGDGNLLRRTNDAQVCTSCHNLPGHQGRTCKDCHETHNTYNIFLFKQQIVTPNRGTVNVDFRYFNPPVQANGSIDAPAGTPTGNGPCEVCHTTTAYYKNTGGAASHNTTCRCTDCHTHASGFAVPTGGNESSGGASCTGCCHSSTANRMNATTTTNPGGQTIVTRHTLSTAESVGNPDNNNPVATWTDPSSVPLGNRSCTNMCHPDHTHAPTHANNVYNDATDASTRSTGGAANTDFDNAQANGGLCISCHKSPITITNATFGTQVHVAISKTKYAGSAHDATNGTYTQHDASTFNRNCTKCHADSADQSPTDSTTPFGAVHYSQYDALLYRDFRGNNSTANFLCYLSGCHSTTDGVRNVQSAMGLAVAHPVNSDTLHDSHNEATATWNSGAFKGANRHANCLDCHNPHEAGRVRHTAGGVNGNAIAADSPLAGATGVQYTPPTTAWAATTAANFSTNPVPATREYEVCFKCHSSFAFGATPPNGISANGSQTTPPETDVAREFNPNNRSYHPVVAGTAATGNTYAATHLKAPWNTNMGTQTMTCSDCHNTAAGSAVAQGPHGSATQFMLKGTNAGNWPNVAPSSYTTSWCASNCHNNITPASSVHSRGDHSSLRCYTCHIVVPHGGNLPRLIADNDTMPSRYAYNGTLNTQNLRAFRVTTGSYSTSYCNAGCYGSHNTSLTDPNYNW